MRQLIAADGLIVKIACMKKSLFIVLLTFSSFIAFTQYSNKD